MTSLVSQLVLWRVQNGCMVEGMGAPIGFPTGIGVDGIDWSARSTAVAKSAIAAAILSLWCSGHFCRVLRTCVRRLASCWAPH